MAAAAEIAIEKTMKFDLAPIVEKYLVIDAHGNGHDRDMVFLQERLRYIAGRIDGQSHPHHVTPQ
jgi:hypothetical protein